MAKVKAASDVLDQVNAALDANNQKLVDLQTEDAQILAMVQVLVQAGAGNVTDEQLNALLSKVSAQSSNLDTVKSEHDTILAAGQQPTE